MPTLLSVDIWDTVLRRRCHPDEVKLFTARMVFMLERERIEPRLHSVWDVLGARIACEATIASEREAAGFDNEYAIEEVFERWLDAILIASISRAQRLALAEMLVLAEVEQECRVVYPDRRMQRVLDWHKADITVGLSDFYMGEKHLRSILSTVCPDLKLQRVFVSADCLVNKMKGRLFAHAQRETGVQPHAHTHIGDNPWSDVQSPKRFGIRSIHYHNQAEERRRAQNRVRYESRQRSDFVSTTHLLTSVLRDRCTVPKGLDNQPAQLYQIGFRAAPIYAALVLGAMEQAHSMGAPAIHYFTREGEFFKRVHEALAPHRPFGLLAPKPVLLEVSRLVTFLPSLREVSTAELMRIWNLYSTQSMAQLLKTLDVNPLPFELFFKKHGIDPDSAIVYPWQNQRVQQLFADPLFVRLIEQQRNRRRTVAVEYMQSKGMGTGPTVIVDVGWRGTIQDNIAHMFPDHPIAGWYMGLFRFLNEQPANTTKHTLGPDGNSDPESLVQIIQNVAPMEMLANTDTGSVRRYCRAPDGSIQANRIHDKSEDAVWQEYTRHYQQGVLDAMPIIARWVQTYAVMPSEMKPMVLDLLRSLKGNPPRVLTQAYFNLTHNETFGVGAFVDKQASIDPKLLAAGQASNGTDPHFVRAIEATDWPQGLLKLLGRDELCLQYNKFREDRARKVDAKHNHLRTKSKIQPNKKPTIKSSRTPSTKNEPKAPTSSNISSKKNNLSTEQQPDVTSPKQLSV